MRARDLARPYPVVPLDSNALEAAHLLAEGRLPGLVVVDQEGHPTTILPGSQVLRFVLPRYVQDDPPLARVFDEAAADKLCGKLADFTVRELLARDRPTLPVVDGDATAMEVAAVMARMHSPLVAVVHGGELLGAITVSSLLDVVLPAR
jgi:CBS domain-containing protein